MNSVGVIPGMLRQVKSKPANEGFEVTPSVISLHTFVASLCVTSVIVSPVHKSIHVISGPCQTTQLDEILSHPFVVPLEFVGIINVLFTITC